MDPSNEPDPRAAARFHATPHVRACEVDGELVLLDLARGEYYGLDDLGTRAWHLLEAGESLDEIARDLAPGYEVELDVLRSDLASLVRDLENAGLVGVTI